MNCKGVLRRHGNTSWRTDPERPYTVGLVHGSSGCPTSSSILDLPPPSSIFPAEVPPRHSSGGGLGRPGPPGGAGRSPAQQRTRRYPYRQGSVASVVSVFLTPPYPTLYPSLLTLHCFSVASGGLRVPHLNWVVRQGEANGREGLKAKHRSVIGPIPRPPATRALLQAPFQRWGDGLMPGCSP
jgi:hypothetical protein